MANQPSKSQTGDEIVKFRKLAKEAPHCMNCGLENPNFDLLCLAHANGIAEGKGIGMKSHDLMGAYLCHSCHDLVDGRKGKLTKYEKRQMHHDAWVKTMKWLIMEGHLG